MSEQFPNIESLSERELEVLKLAATGRSNRQIAEELFIAPGTVRAHLNHIYGKLGVKSRTQAAYRANQLNLFDDIEYNLPPDVVLNPYKGLRAFEEDDADDFFGRDAIIQSIMARLDEQHPLSRFLAVVGPSGSGKSSVIKAGVLPLIREERGWPIADFIPGAHPLEELAVALTGLADTPNPDLLNHISQDKRGLLRTTRLLFPNVTDILLVIDQFEEVFTLVADEEKARLFLDLIYHAVVDPNSPLRIIVTLRADFYDRPLLYPDFSQLIKQRTEVVTPLTADEIERAIVGPIEKIGVRPEKGLVAAVVADVNEQPGALPLLQYALTELFDKRSNSHMSLDAYHSIGGTLGALARRADRIYKSFDADQQEATRQIFLRLITLGEGTEDTRRRVLLSELFAIDEQILPGVLDEFDESRLLTFDADPATHEPTVEVAHEAIIREWGRLRIWLDESRNDIRQHRLLQHSAEQWLAANHDTSYLLSGARLEQFESWADETTLIMTADEEAFLQASIAEREHQERREKERAAHEAALERRSRTILRALVAVFLVAAIVAGGLALFAFDERSAAQDAEATSDVNAVIAQHSAEQSQALFLAAEAEQALEEGDTDLALALVLEAYHLSPGVAGVKRIISSVASAGGTQSIFASLDADIRDFDISHDRSLLAVVTYTTGKVTLWSIADRQMIGQWQIFTQNAQRSNFANGVEISPDNSFIVVGGGWSPNQRVSIVDLESGTIESLPVRSESLIDMQLNPDGSQLAFIDSRANVEIWDIATRQLLHRDSEHFVSENFDLAGENIVYHPSGNILAYRIRDRGESRNEWLIVRDAASLDLIRLDEFRGENGERVVLTDDGRFFLSMKTTNGTQTVQYHDIASGEMLSQMVLYPGTTRTYEIPDDTYIRPDGLAIELVDVSTAASKTRLLGQMTRVADAEFIGTDQLVSAGGGNTGDQADPTIRVWDVATGRTITVLPDRSVLTPAGDLVLAGFPAIPFSLDTPPSPPALYLADVTSGQRVRDITVDVRGIPYNAIFSPDGTHIALAAYDLNLNQTEYSVFTWPDMERVSRFGFEGYDRTPVFNLDGTHLITGQDPLDNSRGRQVARVWEVASGRLVHRNQPWLGVVMFAVELGQTGQIISGGSLDATIQISALDGQTPDQAWELHESIVEAGVLSADHSSLLTGDASGVVIRSDPVRQKLLSQVKFHDVDVTALAFAPDTHPAVSGDFWGRIVMWNLDTGDLLHVFDGHSGSIFDLEFTPDGQHLVSSSVDGTTRIWRVPPYATMEEMVNWLQNNRYIRDFTCEERELFNIQPLCDEDVLPATHTPAPSLTPSSTPTITITPDFNQTTATPTNTPTITPTPYPTRPTHTPRPSRTPTIVPTAEVRGTITLGVPQQGVVRAGTIDSWVFEGTIDQSVEVVFNGFGLQIEVISPDGTTLASGDDNLSVPLILPEDGSYTILIRSGSLSTGIYNVQVR